MSSSSPKQPSKPHQPPKSPGSTDGEGEGEPLKPTSTHDKVLSEISARFAAAQAAQDLAASSREHANSLSDDSEEKWAALEEAAKQESIAAKEMKIVKRLQSGVWQGGAAGAGMGAGVGAGLGTVVGSLVGGVVGIPTTGLGLLVGAGTGAVHGPWVKWGGGKEEEEGEVRTEETVVEGGK